MVGACHFKVIRWHQTIALQTSQQPCTDISINNYILNNYVHVVENGGRKGGRQGIDGLCVVTKTNKVSLVE